MKKILAIFISLFIIYSVSSHEVNEDFVLNATITKSAIRGDVYVYNLSNGKLHTSDCEWAQKCTKNCIYIDKKWLKKMSFIPCIVCGGGIVEPVDFGK